MKKIIGIVVLLAFVGGGYWFYENFANVAKVQTEKLASKTLGVPVKIGSLDIVLSDKEVVLRGLDIGNPDGFENDRIISVETIKIAADSLANKTLVFNEIVIDGTDINLEVTEKGTNFTALQKLMAASKQAPESEADKNSAAAKADQYKVIIKRLLINNATLTPSSNVVTTTAMDRFIMPDIAMSSIGTQQGGVSASEAMAIVMSNLSDAVLKTALKSGYLEGLSKKMLRDMNLQYNLSGAFADKVTSDFKKAGEELKGIFGKSE